MLDRPRWRALAMFGLVALALPFLASYPPLGVSLSGLLIVVAGRATLLAILGPCAIEVRQDRRAPAWGFIGIAFGGALVLATAVLLRLADFYGFASSIAALVAITCIACTRAEVRRSLLVPPARSWPFVVGCLVYVLIVAALIPTNAYPALPQSAVYLTQGFDLFLPKDPSEWPYFGERAVLPMMYVTHTIGTVFALLSHGDQFDYYTRGLYWLNVLLTPLVPIGAYLFFRRRLPWWVAIVAALGFCWSVLEWRLWSIRGETLGWIFGFAFLLTFEELMSRLADVPPQGAPVRRPEHAEAMNARGSIVRIAIVLSFLFVAMALTHGVAAMMAAFVSAGLGLHALLTRRAGLADVFRAGALSGAIVAALFVAYAYSFSGHLSLARLISNYDHVPVPGTPDSAVLIDSALFYPRQFDPPAVRAAPPLVPASDIVQITAFLPLASLFRPPAPVGLDQFPAALLRKLDDVSPIERGGYMALLLGCCLFQLARRSDACPGAGLFWAAVTTYALIVGFSLYLDYSSVSIYPLASSRRTYVYVRFFYGLALGLTVCDLAGVCAEKWRSAHLAPAIRLTQSASRCEVPIFFALLAIMLLSSLSSRGVSFATQIHDFGRRAAAVVGGGSLHAPARWDPRLDSLVEAVAFVRDRTARGDWVFSNIVSDNQFWYLSDGRYSLLEGSVMYQVYDLQRRAAERTAKFIRFADTADETIVDEYGAQYVLLYKHRQCDPPACYGYNVIPARFEAFARNPGFSKVLDNDQFAVFRRERRAQRP